MDSPWLDTRHVLENVELDVITVPVFGTSDSAPDPSVPDCVHGGTSRSGEGRPLGHVREMVS